MKVELIGSGGWDGLPSAFCRCSVCVRAAKDPASKDNRTRPLLKVSNKGESFCIDIGPDFRMQSSRHNLEVDTFFVSHWHYDHLFGIYELGAWYDLMLNKKPVVYCSRGTSEYIRDHMGFMNLDVRVLRSYEPLAINDLTVTPIPMLHMHSMDSDKNANELDTLGFIVDDGSKKIAYLADYYELPHKSLELVMKCDIVVADGTYLFEDHYPDDTLRNAFKQYQDPDHLHGEDILGFTKSLKSNRVAFHSITHLPEMSHEDMQNNMPENHFIGYDGMVITD